MLLPRLLPVALLASSAAAITLTGHLNYTTTIVESATTITAVVTYSTFTTEIYIPTTSPYAAPSGASILEVEAAKDVFTTFAIAPSVNSFVAPVAQETVTAGKPYTIKWKPTTQDKNEKINLMLYKSNTTRDSVLEPVQTIMDTNTFDNYTFNQDGSISGTANSWTQVAPLNNNGSATFTPRDNLISGENYIILSNGASGVNRSPFFTIHNDNPAFQHEPLPPKPAKAGLSTAQVAGIIGGVGGFVVLVAISVFCFCLARNKGFFVRKFKAETDYVTFGKDWKISYPKKYHLNDDIRVDRSDIVHG